MNYQETRSYIVAAAILLLFGGVAVDFIGIAMGQVFIAIIGGLLTFIGGVLIFVWIVKYLHELDERLAHVESYLEDTTQENKP